MALGFSHQFQGRERSCPLSSASNKPPGALWRSDRSQKPRPIATPPVGPSGATRPQRRETPTIPRRTPNVAGRRRPRADHHRRRRRIRPGAPPD